MKKGTRKMMDINNLYVEDYNSLCKKEILSFTSSSVTIYEAFVDDDYTMELHFDGACKNKRVYF